MPKIIVGYAQKIGEANFGSRGANVTLELDLEAPLAPNADRTRAQIAGLFRLARQAVAEELARSPAETAGSTQPGVDNGKPPVSLAQSSVRRATANQLRAIAGLAAKHRINLAKRLHKQFKISRAEDLSLMDASALIDEMKACENAK